MDWSEILKLAAPIVGIVGSLIVGLLIFIMRRAFKSIDTLFALLGAQDKRIKVLELVAMQSDPESTGLFRALTASGNGHG